MTGSSRAPHTQPLSHLALFYILTAGLYWFYWQYRNWRDFRAARGWQVSPGLRAVGSLIPGWGFGFWLEQLTRMADSARQAGVVAYRPLNILAAWLGLSALGLLPLPASFLGLLSVLPILIVQKTLNAYWETEQPSAPAQSDLPPDGPKLSGAQSDTGRHDSGAKGKLIYVYLMVLLAAVLFFVVQRPLLASWIGSWTGPASHYPYGSFIPLFAAFMLWTNRYRLASTGLRPCWAGLAALCVFVVIHAFSVTTGTPSLSAVAFVFCVCGAVLLMCGWQVTGIALMPVLFLATMIPVAPSTLDALSMRLQLTTTALTAKIMVVFGIDVTQHGSMISSPDLPEPLMVGVAASGLRTVIALAMLTWFLAYVVRASWWKKAILVAASVPLGILANSLRIAVVGVGGSWTGSPQTMHWLPDTLGFVWLPVCFAAMILVAQLLRMGGFDPKEDSAGVTVQSRMPPAPAVLWRGAVAIGLLAMVTVMSFAAGGLYDLPRAEVSAASLPASFGQWTSRKLPVERTVLDELRGADLIQRTYIDDTGWHTKQVHVIVSASRDPQAFHDPMVALSAVGRASPIATPITLRFSKPKPLRVRATSLQVSGEYDTSLVVYWYMLGDRSYATTQEARNESRRLRLGDATRLLLTPWTVNKLRQHILSREFIWYRFSTGDGDLASLTEFIRDFVAQSRGFAR